MGLTNRASNRTFVRIKNGKFYMSSDKDLTTPYDQLEGVITGMEYKNEEYNGVPNRKMYLNIQDEESIYRVGVNVETSMYSGLIGFLANINIAQPLTLHAREEQTTTKEGKEISRQSILVSQEGKFAKGYFTKDNPHGIPAWETVTIGKKKVTDKSAFNDFLENFVATTLVPKLSAPEQPVAKNTEQEDEDSEQDPFPTKAKAQTADLPWS